MPLRSAVPGRDLATRCRIASMSFSSDFGKHLTIKQEDREAAERQSRFVLLCILRYIKGFYA
jgi:hypothetical protein